MTSFYKGDFGNLICFGDFFSFYAYSRFRYIQYVPINFGLHLFYYKNKEILNFT